MRQLRTLKSSREADIHRLQIVDFDAEVDHDLNYMASQEVCMHPQVAR